MHTSGPGHQTTLGEPAGPSSFKHDEDAENNTSPEPIHVLDLPPLYTKPDGGQLLSVLRTLTLKPASFDLSSPNGDPASTLDSTSNALVVDETGIPRYLTSIISSSLKWIDNDSLREEIWENASQRLAERAGRSAAPSLTRTFTLPSPSTADKQRPPIEISIHEPTLTADNLGHKTWSSSYVLAQQLRELTHLLLSPSPTTNTTTNNTNTTTNTTNLSNQNQHLPRKILELGSGTGLLGISFAALVPHSAVHLTDLPEIIPNLTHNIGVNAHLAAAVASTLSAGALDWNSCPHVPLPLSAIAAAEPATAAAPESAIYDVILAADPIYSPHHPSLLARAVWAHLARSQEARFVLGLPLRDAYAVQIEELWGLLRGLGLCVLEQGQVRCTDDWVDREGGRVGVVVRWAVWGWGWG